MFFKAVVSSGKAARYDHSFNPYRTYLLSFLSGRQPLSEARYYMHKVKEAATLLAIHCHHY